MNLSDFLKQFVSFPPEELEDIISHFEKEMVQKNQTLVSQGQVCKKLYFLETGLGRSYYLKKTERRSHNGSLPKVSPCPVSKVFSSKTQVFTTWKCWRIPLFTALPKRIWTSLFEKYHRYGKIRKNPFYRNAYQSGQ